MNTTMSHPGWRPLTVLAVLVVLAHALVLSASPTQFGGGREGQAAGAKALNTRSIDAPPAPAPLVNAALNSAPPVAPQATQAVRPRTPLARKAPKNDQIAPKNASNSAIADVNTAQAAPELIAQTQPPVTETTADATLTAALTAPPIDTPIAATTPTAALAQAVTAAPSGAALVGPSPTSINAVKLPGPVRLLYKVVGQSKNMNYQANAELAWKTNGDSYDVAMKVSAFLIGSRSYTSVGKITPTGLAPTRFADKFKNELAAHFQADKGKITFSANTPDAPWVNGVQDRVSVFMQLGGVLAADPTAFPAGSNITFLTVGPRDTDTWTFIVEAEENVDLLGSPLPTVKVTRKPRKEFDQKVEIWYAPSLGYLPVRNRITQPGGDFVEQQLTEVVKL